MARYLMKVDKIFQSDIKEVPYQKSRNEYLCRISQIWKFKNDYSHRVKAKAFAVLLDFPYVVLVCNPGFRAT
jgi:hypothetical protein